MKYARLTREQLNELHPEFATFLASQSIDRKEWDELKRSKPEIAEQEIDVFSDMIWDKALTNVNFIDHFSKNYIFLFKCVGDEIFSIVVNTKEKSIDFLTEKGIDWLGENIFSPSIDILRGKKDISHDRNGSLFELIKKGGNISKGELYLKFEALLENQ